MWLDYCMSAAQLDISALIASELNNERVYCPLSSVITKREIQLYRLLSSVLSAFAAGKLRSQQLVSLCLVPPPLVPGSLRRHQRLAPTPDRECPSRARQSRLPGSAEGGLPEIALTHLRRYLNDRKKQLEAATGQGP